MSFFPGKDPAAGDVYACEAIDQVIVPRTVDLGEASRCGARCLRRARAWSARSSSSTISGRPSFAPAPASTCGRIRISGSRPSPICSTARSCTATASAPRRAIRPGEVNWMTAGRGIVHSERTGPNAASTGSPIHGLQMWVALPAAKEEMDAGFAHHDRRNFRS